MAAAGAWTDGLEEFEPGNVQWPFKRAGVQGNAHFGWHFVQEAQVFCFRDDYIPGLPNEPCVGCRTPSEVHVYWNSAVVSLQTGHLFDASESFQLAMESKVNKQAPVEDSMLQAFSCVYRGMILLGIGHGYHNHSYNNDIRLVKNYREAVTCFKRGTIEYGLPACKYFYGRSLIRGTGGVNRNVAVGIQYLHEAGAERIGEAFFELGWVYEEGGDGTKDSLPGIDTRSRAAIDFYNAAAETYALTCNVRNMSWLPQTGNIEMILSTKRWQSIQDSLGEISGSRYSLSVASQAFLFGAAAALRTPLQPDHYSTLLIIIPCIGIALAITSWLQWVEAYSRDAERRHLMYGIQNAKIKAYIAIAVAGASNKLSLSSGSFAAESLLTRVVLPFELLLVGIVFLVEAVLMLFFSLLKVIATFSLVHLFFGWLEVLKHWERPRFQWWWFANVVLFRTIVLLRLKNFSKYLQVMFLELSVPIVATIFLFAWIILLNLENASRELGCSVWDESPCERCATDCDYDDYIDCRAECINNSLL